MCSLKNVLSMRQTVQTGPSRRDRMRMNMTMRYMHNLQRREPAVVRVRRAVRAPGDSTLSASFAPLPCFVCATRRLKLFLSSSRFSSAPRAPPTAPQLGHEIMCSGGARAQGRARHAVCPAGSGTTRGANAATPCSNSNTKVQCIFFGFRF
jgi:hypothetical protein